MLIGVYSGGWLSLEFAFELSLHCATGQILESARTFQECGLHKINISLAPYSAAQRKTYGESDPDRGVQIIAKEKIAG